MSANTGKKLSKSRNKLKGGISSGKAMDRQTSLSSMKKTTNANTDVKYFLEANNYVTHTQVKQMIDKLGEEIAFDINQIEGSTKQT
jgi:hypothetical protein